MKFHEYDDEDEVGAESQPHTAHRRQRARFGQDGQRQQTPSPCIQLIPFDEIRLGVRRHDLVKGLIPRVGLTVIWGPPKCGKSFWTFDLMMHVGLGWKYRGRRVQQGPVVYCAFEGQTGFEARV